MYVEEILSFFGLLSVKDSFIGDDTVRGISGGQKRRVTLARGFVAGSQIVFADEPTSGLSATDAELCVRAMTAASRKMGTAFVVVIHQPRVGAWPS
jgi:ABC-type multidrug transport system ATPase subunit